MASEFKSWAENEREFIREDIKWLKAGAKLLSPSGEDISAKKIEQLEARLEHVEKVLKELDEAGSN